MRSNIEDKLLNLFLILLSGFILNKIEIFALLNFRPLTTFIIIILISIICFFCYDNLKNLISRQKIYNKKTWVYFLGNSLIGAPILSIVLSIFNDDLVRDQAMYWYYNIYSAKDYSLLIYLSLFNFLLSVFIYYGYDYLCKIATPKNINNKIFAPDAVGVENDELGFSKALPSVIKGIKKSNNYINVLAIDGEYGSGKSSFARMIVEQFEFEENILYSYISLTETNETKDFSKLFSERWTETINAKYPIINLTETAPLLRKILQESKNGFLYNVLDILMNLNFCFNRIKDKVSGVPLSKDITRMFGDLSEIEEDNWIFTIDELDRAKLSEIYRITEVLERFKIHASGGFPIKITFLLCFSEKDLRKFLSEYENKNELAFLLKTFFMDDKKSINFQILTPPTDYDVKKNFIIKKFNAIAKNNNLKIEDKLNVDLYLNDFETISSFVSDDKETVGLVLNLILNETPRIINRIKNRLEFIYSYRSDKEEFRFPDILLMVYVEFKLPFLKEFFSKTINLLKGIDDENSMSGFAVYLKFKHFRENKITMIDYIADVLDMDDNERKLILDKNKKIIEGVMHLIGARYYDVFNYENPPEINKYLDCKTLSYPNNMLIYLQSLPNSEKSTKLFFNEIYNKNKKGLFPELNNENLLDYADFVKGSRSNFPITNYLIKEITQRIIDGRIKKTFCYIGDTIYQNAVFKVIFLAMHLINISDSSLDKPSKEIELAFNSLKNILTSPGSTLRSKYTILNSFVNNRRGDGVGVHYELNNAYDVLYKYFSKELPEIINKVMSDYKDYLNKDIYVNEENFVYVLFHSWSGKKDDKYGIEEIRSIASRNLFNYPTAVDIYWSRYTYKDDYEYHIDDFITYYQIIKFDFETKISSSELYMPLIKLCEITKMINIDNLSEESRNKFNFWSKILEKYPDWCNKNIDFNEESTLKSVLIERGLIH